MEGRENGDRFPELFGLIEEYAGGGGDRGAMALKVIGGAYLPSCESGGLTDAKRVVDDRAASQGRGQVQPTTQRLGGKHIPPRETST